MAYLCRYSFFILAFFFAAPLVAQNTTMTEAGDEAAANGEYSLARALYEKSCMELDAAACPKAAKLFQGDKGGPADIDKAYALSMTGCESGDFRSCNYVGYYHYAGMGRPVDYGEALPWFVAACANGAGYPSGCNNIGVLYREGQGVARDPSRAVGYFSMACERDYAFGCTNWGRIIETREGDAITIAQAQTVVTAYTRGCELGDANGCRNMALLTDKGELVEADPAAELGWRTKACDLGRGDSCYKLGVAELDKGAAADRKAAIAIFDKGCELGDGDSCRVAAVQLEEEGPLQNLERSFAYQGKACEAGNGAGCNSAGDLTDDPVAAQAFYLKGCELENYFSCADAARNFLRGDPAVADPARAVEMYSDMCPGGGCYKLARAYQQGKFLAKNLKKARYWYRRGCDAGEDGCSAWIEMLREGQGGPADPGKAAWILVELCMDGSRIHCEMESKREKIVYLARAKDYEYAMELAWPFCEDGEDRACDYVAEGQAAPQNAREQIASLRANGTQVRTLTRESANGRAWARKGALEAAGEKCAGSRKPRVILWDIARERDWPNPDQYVTALTYFCA